MWHRVAPALAEHFTVVLADLPGYGWSAVAGGRQGSRALHQARDGDRRWSISWRRSATCASASRATIAADASPIASRSIIPAASKSSRCSTSSRPGTCGRRWTRGSRCARGTGRSWRSPTRCRNFCCGKSANEYFDLLTAAWKRGKDTAFDDRAIAHYRASFTDPLRIHAGCEDYRAGQSTDFAHDDADRKAGKKITCPMLAIWGATGLPSQNSPLEVWREWATDVRGFPIESGHFLCEENPEATIEGAAGILQSWIVRKVSHAQIDRQRDFTGTKEVADALRFDVASAGKLSRHATSQDFSGPLTVRQFKGGQSNPTYLLETPQRRYVLRRKPPGKLLPSAHAVDREFRVITRAACAGLSGRRTACAVRRTRASSARRSM